MNLAGPTIRALGAAMMLAAAVSAQQPPQPPTQKPLPGSGGLSVPNADPFPSTYAPFPSPPDVIRNVNILTAAGPLIRRRPSCCATARSRRSARRWTRRPTRS